jgi:hypothetical protein
MLTKREGDLRRIVATSVRVARWRDRVPARISRLGQRPGQGLSFLASTLQRRSFAQSFCAPSAKSLILSSVEGVEQITVAGRPLG